MSKITLNHGIFVYWQEKCQAFVTVLMPTFLLIIQEFPHCGRVVKGSVLRDARWFESPWQKYFLMEYKSVYVTDANSVSWGIWGATMCSE